MANIILGCLLAICFGLCGVQTLNPTFDKETLGLQYAMTDFSLNANGDTSVRALVTEMGNQIPMNLSPECKVAVDNWMFDMLRKEEYALLMADAFGKLPTGIVMGNILLFGHFDQCLGIRRFNNATQQMEPAANYCMARLTSPLILAKLTKEKLPAYGVCLPRECANRNDTNAFISGMIKITARGKDVDAVKGICVNPLPKTAGFYIMVCLIALILLVVTAAGVVDCIYRRRYKESPNGYLTAGSDVNDTPVHIYEQSKVVNGNGLTITTQHMETTHQHRKPKYGYANVPAFLKPLLCFNIMNNFKSILSPGVTEGEISFLHGFRVLSMFWIILGHTYYIGKNFFSNQTTFFSDVRTASFQLILNAGYSVDSFFLLSGLLITYVLYRDLAKQDGRLNWALVYIHRWWRLTPVYMFVMLFYVYVLPYGISSPFKLVIAQDDNGIPTDHCKRSWWTNILYINNFVPAHKAQQCMPWTWFLALDMQFFIITPILVILLYKSRSAGFGVIGVLVAACVATTMGLIGHYGLPVHWGQLEQPVYNASETGYDKNYDYIWEKPYTRITPFLIGVVLGYLFISRPADKTATGGRFLKGLIGWSISAALAIPLLFGFYFTGFWSNYPYDAKQDMSVTSRVMYGGLQRLGWSMVVGWVLFACQYGYAGPVRRFLGSRFWRPLSNLTYGAYLVHMLTIQLYFASQRHMIFYSPLNMVVIFLAQLFMAYAVALLIAVLVEVPLLRLERLLVRKTL